ncbi:MAG: hypothetical protein ABSE57_24755 [Bryobacteraceae bacterium]|jgi:hypothetical protein
MKTLRLTIDQVKALKIAHCEDHTNRDGSIKRVELRVIVYCPGCRGHHGGTKAAKTMTAAEKTRRARKAARTRWRKAKAAKK